VSYRTLKRSGVLLWGNFQNDALEENRGEKMWIARSIILAVGVSVIWLQSPVWCQQPALQKGDVIFKADFEGDKALAGRSGAARLGDGWKSARSLFVGRSEPSGEVVEHDPQLGLNTRVLVEPGKLKTTYAEFSLPVEKLCGYALSFSVMIKAEGVTVKPKEWEGIRFAARFVTADGKEDNGDNQWPGINIDTGTFDWRPCAFKVNVPENAAHLVLTVGLDSVAGKVWFDNIKGSVRRVPLPPVPQQVEGRSGYTYKGDLARLRGVTFVAECATEENLRMLGQEWNANLIRFCLSWEFASSVVPFDYNALLQKQMRETDEILPICEKYGIKVVILPFLPGSEKVFW